MPNDKWPLDRRGFLGATALLGWGTIHPGSRVGDSAPPRAVEYFRNDLERVQAVVGASHFDFDRVRALVEEQPCLAKASWDWGFGDWESALGAASHTGRREIAEFLIARGARPTLFSAAMLGEVDVVRAHLEADSTLAGLHGPHGISLIRHARAGGDEATPVVDYLVERFGDEADEPFGFPGDEVVEARYAGVYVDTGHPTLRLSVAVRGGWLLIGGGETPQSRVREVGPDTFHPTGAPAVRIRFQVVSGRAARALVEDGALRWNGERVA